MINTYEELEEYALDMAYYMTCANIGLTALPVKVSKDFVEKMEPWMRKTAVPLGGAFANLYRVALRSSIEVLLITEAPLLPL